MESLVQLFHHYGLWIVFTWVLAESLGAPLPSLPLLLAVGALAAAGETTLLQPLLVAVVATMIGDILWYEVGKRKGRPVLHLMCRMSMNPDACVLQTENVFHRYGHASLLFAKFIPGLSTVTPPVAGHMRMPQRRFLLFDLGGSVLWAGSVLGLGYFLRQEVHRLGPSLISANHALLLVILLSLGGLCSYKLLNYYRRQREQEMPKIDPEALWQKLQDGKGLLILDVRDPIQLGADSVKVKGAVHVPASEVASFLRTRSSKEPVVIYCG